MVSSIDDTKRLAIGERLADLRAFQNLIISNEQKLIDVCPLLDDTVNGGLEESIGG